MSLEADSIADSRWGVFHRERGDGMDSRFSAVVLLCLCLIPGCDGAGGKLRFRPSPMLGLQRLRGGGLPRSERNYRKRQAEEQVKTGIGKSMWRREKPAMSQRAQRSQNILDQIKEKASELSKNAEVSEVARRSATRIPTTGRHIPDP